MTLIVWDVEKNVVRKARREDLYEAIYMITQLIPLGRVTSYKNISEILGVNPRLVGQALKNNDKPIIIPCHRVIASNGYLKNYSRGGIVVKKKLLVIEGVIVKGEKVSRKYFIDLKKILS
ncbi:MAG: MGMT family protein [Desulfurococcaceae archaeon]